MTNLIKYSYPVKHIWKFILCTIIATVILFALIIPMSDFIIIVFVRIKQWTLILYNLSWYFKVLAMIIGGGFIYLQWGKKW